MTNSNGVAARAVDLHKVYGEGEAAVAAVDGVTVDFLRGEFTAVMGPSGSGKSTLCTAWRRWTSPTSGQVYLGETELGSLKDKALTTLRRDKIGFVFQASTWCRR